MVQNEREGTMRNIFNPIDPADGLPLFLCCESSQTDAELAGALLDVPRTALWVYRSDRRWRDTIPPGCEFVPITKFVFFVDEMGCQWQVMPWKDGTFTVVYWQIEPETGELMYYAWDGEIFKHLLN